jgi:hypothetical protein
MHFDLTGCDCLTAEFPTGITVLPIVRMLIVSLEQVFGVYKQAKPYLLHYIRACEKKRTTRLSDRRWSPLSLLLSRKINSISIH